MNIFRIIFAKQSCKVLQILSIDNILEMNTILSKNISFEDTKPVKVHMSGLDFNYQWAETPAERVTG